MRRRHSRLTDFGTAGPSRVRFVQTDLDDGPADLEQSKARSSVAADVIIG
jgi:hypothetical protein